MDELLKSKRVVVCAGSGGVGKTTMSAALGVRAAQLGLRVLVLTVDPAKRLATALGLKSMSDEDVEVPNQNFPGRLFAGKINPKHTFDKFVNATLTDDRVRELLFKNPLYDKMATTLGGSQEFTSLERLYQSLQKQTYDLIILDTPPAAHAIEFLDSTEKLEELFQESVLKWFMVPFEQHSRFSQFFNKGSRIALKAFEFLAGSQFLNNLSDLLGAVYQLRLPLLARFREIRSLLRGPSTAFILVTGFDVDKIKEARFFRSELLRRDVRLNHIIVNRAFPRWYDGAEATAAPVKNALFEYYKSLARFYKGHQKAFDQLEADVGASVKFLRIVDFDSEIFDLASLEKVSEELGLAAGAQRGNG